MITRTAPPALVASPPLALLWLALGLAACGGGDGSNDTSDPSDGDVATDTTTLETVDDVSDVPDTADTRDVPDTADVADTADTRDVADTVDSDEVSDTDLPDTDPGDTLCSVDTGPSDTGSTADVPGPTCDFSPNPDDGGFNDHTIGAIESEECFFAWAGPSTYDPVVVKFTVPDFFASDAPVRFYENGVFALHDEWYWFRLLNGHAIARLDDPLAQPIVNGPSFPSIAAIYAAFTGIGVLPLDLAWLSDFSRLYSRHFYDLCGFTTDGSITRFFGVGSVIHFAANPERRFPGEIWGFELEYVELATVANMERYFAHLATVLPSSIADRIVWLSRSKQQDAVAAQIRAGSSAYKERVLTYDDLVVDGEVQAYNPGITAGVIHVLPETWSESDVKPDEIVIVPRVPDDIPPTRGIVSAVPQTALAHVNLLAKSRGTPNAYVGGILQWGQLGIWDYQRTPVVLEITGHENDGAVRWQPISNTDYATYQTRLAVPVRHITQVADLSSAPYSVDLGEGGTEDMASLVPLIGGKCAGFFSFLDVPGMETPEAPMCITIRPYAEHVAEFVAMWRAMAQHPTFMQSPKARLLLLEGREAFDEATASDPAAAVWRADFEAAHANDVLGEVLSRGGVQKMIRNKPVDPTTLAQIRALVIAQYGFLDETQGIRFRSSSTAEDVIGFNGAGLHDSNTGFINPSKAIDPDDRKKSIDWAMKKTWASYWNYNAFEERRAGKIDHFEGSMALAVHPRFDDDRELANGVVTHYTTQYGPASHHRFVLNIQAGPLAITNPGGSTARAEIDEVTQLGDGEPSIRRLQRSDLVDACTWLVSDDELLLMFELSKQHQQIWLDAENAKRPFAERNHTLVLDMEMKRMAAGWPALASGEIKPSRILFRQSRVLDSPPAVTAAADPWLGASFPITAFMPQDLRTVAERVVIDACSSPYFDIRTYRISTPRAVDELFPFAETPYVYKALVAYKQDAPGFDWPTVAYWLPNGSMASASANPAVGIRLNLAGGTATTLGTDAIEIDYDGTWRIKRGDQLATGTCTIDQRLPYASPAEFLRGLLLPQ